MGSVAYRLKLPSSSNIHPVFHVSLLKKVTGTLPPLISTLPTDISVVQVPELVLDNRLKNKNNRVVRQLLIKWSGMPAEMATWEDEDEVRTLLPDASACGKAEKLGRKNVMIRQVGTEEELIKPREEERTSRPVRAKKPSVHVVGPNWVK